MINLDNLWAKPYFNTIMRRSLDKLIMLLENEDIENIKANPNKFCKRIIYNKTEEFAIMPEGMINIVDFINYPSRIYPIGRLDKDSTGLILLTNRGEIVNGILKARNYHEKEYVVSLNRPYSRDFLKQMRNGVYLHELDTTTRKCEVRPISDRTFSIILTQGLNRQIRRMCKELGYRVEGMNRIRVMNVELGDLPLGKYREIQGKELDVLLKSIE